MEGRTAALPPRAERIGPEWQQPLEAVPTAVPLELGQKPEGPKPEQPEREPKPGEVSILGPMVREGQKFAQVQGLPRQASPHELRARPQQAWESRRVPDYAAPAAAESWLNRQPKPAPPRE